MMRKGLVSVVMAVHNEQESFLRTAFASMFDQTYRDWEMIVIDDASDDTCQTILQELCKDKENVRIVRNESNLGLTKSLNRGLALANGVFIARMDADDVSVPERLSKQVEFLAKHPDIDIVGAGVVSFGNENIFMSPAFGYDNNKAQCNLFFSSTLCHPSVMIRKDFLNQHHLQYDENVKKGQDYDMWERCSEYGKLAVMTDVLLFYRTHSKQITSTNRSDQNTSADTIRKRRLKRIGINATDREYQCHLLLASGVNKEISAREMKVWVEKVLRHNAEQKFVDVKSLIDNLYERLTLYKMRNEVRLTAYRPFEILTIVRILLDRFRMRIKIQKENKQLQKILMRYEK